MNYLVYILGKTHKLVQGFTISEEYNETLDSGTIIISNSEQLDLNPYDDVFIFSEYCGYYDVDLKQMVPNYSKKFVFKGYPINSSLYTALEKPYFYKHFLIDQFSEPILILDDDPSKIRYQYTIDLFSETKGLETVPAPNISITQPLNNKVLTVTYVDRFLELYNEKMKKATANNLSDWTMVNKYCLGNVNTNYCFAVKEIKPISINDGWETFAPTNAYILIKGFEGEKENLGTYSITSPSYPNDIIKLNDIGCCYHANDINSTFSIKGQYEYIKICIPSYNVPTLFENVDDVFKNSYTPDFTLNNPSLRQILEKLFITKDCIPVVLDDQIYALDITKRRGDFNLKQGEINYITGSKSSDNYCTNLKRSYTDGLAQEQTGRYVEYLGFRNSNTALLTLDNMRIETGFPIYKINKLYMCYYKKIKIYVKTPTSDSDESYERIFLCKQDITKLIKLNSERNALSEQITDFNNNPPENIDQLAKYKLATLGYDIGSNTIDGWGVQYSYPNHFWWENEIRTYIENILYFMNKYYPMGIYNIDYFINKIFGGNSLPEGANFYVEYPSPKNAIDCIEIPTYGDYSQDFLDVVNYTGDQLNTALHLKHLFFEMDYTPFFSGTINQSKGLIKGKKITINDNQSSSLALLELDGLAQKEKINRYGNKGIKIDARYKNTSQIQSLGSVYEKNLDKDVVIYHKEYSINDNVINCTYFGTKDYVLKNYFTSVYAKHRTYNLMSYGESVSRPENKTIYVLISTKRLLKDNSSNMEFTNFVGSFEQRFFSFFDSTATQINYKIDKIKNKNKLNYGYFVKTKLINGTPNYEYFVADSNIFVSGTSLCLNIAMKDNVTVGNFISQMHNEYIIKDKENYMVGATQDFAWLTNEADGVSGGTTGFLTKLGVYFAHVGGTNNDFINDEELYNYNSEGLAEITRIYNNKLLKLPKIESLPTMSNVIGFNENIYKDNKERINMTVQFEPITDSNVYISPWVSKLSDLFGVYNKFTKDIIYDVSYSTVKEDYYVLAGFAYEYYARQSGFPCAIIVIDKTNPNWRDYLTNASGNDVYNVAKINFITKSPYNNDHVTSLEVTLKGINSFNESTPFGATLNMGVTLKGEVGDSGQFTVNDTWAFKETYRTSAPVASDEIFDDSRIVYKILQECGVSTSGINTSDYLILRYYPYYNGYGIIDIGGGNGKNLSVIPSPDGTLVNAETDIGGGLSGYVYFKKQNTKFEVATPDQVDRTYNQNLFWVSTPANYKFREHMVYDELDNLDNFTVLDFDTDIRVNFGGDYTIITNIQDINCVNRSFNSLEDTITIPYSNSYFITNTDFQEIKNNELKLDDIIIVKDNGIPNRRVISINNGYITLEKFAENVDNVLIIRHPQVDETSHILCYYKYGDKYNFVFGFKPDENATVTKVYISPLSFNDVTIYDEDSNLPIGEVPNELE